MGAAGDAEPHQVGVRHAQPFPPRGAQGLGRVIQRQLQSRQAKQGPFLAGLGAGTPRLVIVRGVTFALGRPRTGANSGHLMADAARLQAYVDTLWDEAIVPKI
ncbi:hypothetical protein CPI28_02680 [Moraxella catarrhalis]|nr:hypothetical protein [Moraxella catarrhalis]